MWVPATGRGIRPGDERNGQEYPVDLRHLPTKPECGVYLGTIVRRKSRLLQSLKPDRLASRD